MFCFCCWFSVLWSKCQGCHHKYSYRYIAAFCLSLVLLCIDQMAYIRSKIETLCPPFNRLKAIPWQRLKNLKNIKTANPHTFNSTNFCKESNVIRTGEIFQSTILLLLTTLFDTDQNCWGRMRKHLSSSETKWTDVRLQWIFTNML